MMFCEITRNFFDPSKNSTSSRWTVHITSGLRVIHWQQSQISLGFLLKINEQVELFDRLQDPAQMINVADNPEYKSVLVECEKELQRQISETDFARKDWPRN